jgi:hypothetical protein
MTYSGEIKQKARQLLEESDDNVKYVSEQLDIPLRTIYRWRKKWQKNMPSSLSLALGITDAELDAMFESHYEKGEYTELREMLMKHVKNIASDLSDNPHAIYQRSLALTRLLDKVLQLEEMTRKEGPKMTIIAYRDETDGKLYSMPPWSDDHPLYEMRYGPNSPGAQEAARRREFMRQNGSKRDSPPDSHHDE